MTYKIEDGVPLLPRRGGANKPSELTETIRALLVGQSFFWPFDDESVPRGTVQARIHERASRENMKLATRKVEGGYRIWRIE